MKKISYPLVILFILVSLVPTVAFAYTGSNETVVDLIAGQHSDAGDIKVWNDKNNLYVQYVAATNWCLDETHLQVASSLSDIPQSKGNPVPGQFDYKKSHGCVSNFTYTVPLTSNSCDLYIAAHAVVKKKSGPTETAWGNGIDFSGNNWATYFQYSVDGCNIAPSSTTTSTPTSTASPTQTATTAGPTATSTPTNTSTPTVTATNTATNTSTPTTTTTNTPTSTSTLTATATNTPTNTPSPTTSATSTSTNTVTPTATSTNTATPTATSTVCQPTVVVADFSQIMPGASVEGVGVVAPYLDIDAKGTAVKILEATLPDAYRTPNSGINTIFNDGIAAGGGFSDITTRVATQAHLYTFTFAGVAVSDFSLHMLDYGDWNPSLNTVHSVSMTAYDRNGALVAQQEINYTTQAEGLPRSSNLYGDLFLTGDAATALPGQLGNWTWNISGSGIVKIVLEFGPGFDPAMGFDTLSFTTKCP